MSDQDKIFQGSNGDQDDPKASEGNEAPENLASEDQTVENDADTAPASGDDVPVPAGDAKPAVPEAGDGGDGGQDGGDGSDAAGAEDLPEMGLLEHLDELRKRLTRIFIAAFVGLMICYSFAQQIFDYLLRPLKPLLPEGSHLIFTSLPEGFFTYIKLSAVAGIFLTSPYIFYQLWQFVAPGLYKDERRWLVPIAFFSALFFCSGAVFGYVVVFPLAFEFFMGFTTEIIRPMPALKEYLSFTLKLLIAFGVAFELPLFIFFLARLGMVTSKSLRKFRKYAILLAFIASAVLTPPDVVSQTFMAGPLIILYELGIWVAHFFGKRREPEVEEDEEVEKAAS